MMTAFRVIVLIVLVLSGFGTVADGNNRYVNTFLASGALFLASVAIEALL